ncbi:MAG TPA: hypothetical protein VFZ89_11320 [Solirubrobacteraceae bacterium]
MSQGSIPSRLGTAWRNLQATQRRVVLAALVLLLSMFLPWYSRNTSAASDKGLQTDHDPTSAISVFTFVEAAIFLVAIGVTLLMFARGERRAFHLPGGDGTIITAAGGWAAFLVFYRFVDQPSGGTSQSIAYDYGLHWGIFFGMLASLFLAYAGNALRSAHVVEPPLPGDVRASTGPPPDVPEHQDPVPVDPRPRPTRDRAPTVVAPRTSAGKRQAEEEPSDQLSFDDEPKERPARRQLPFGEPPEFEDPPS